MKANLWPLLAVVVLTLGLLVACGGQETAAPAVEEIDLTTVSYTHLDVYKRQVLAVILPAADELEEGHRGQDDGDEQEGCGYPDDETRRCRNRVSSEKLGF